MAAPCKKCGATKTEPLRKGLRKNIARRLGYDLRRCARCRKLRLLDREQNEPQKPRAVLLPANEDPASGTVPNASVYLDPDAFHGCPRCGAWNYHRSPRGWFERVLLRRPPMLRCYTCKFRFPSPQF